VADSFTIDLGGVRLETAWFGERESARPTLVLLHEGLGCIAMWRDFPQTLAEATGCPVFAYSRQGYGRSDPISLPRPLTYMHDEASDVLPHLFAAQGIDDAILIGHSDGASIAAIYAGSAPAIRLRGIVLIAPHFFNEDLCVETIEAARGNFETGDLRARLERYHGDNTDCAFYGWNGAWLDPGFRVWNIEQFLPKTQTPVLLFWGANDPYGTMAQVEAAQRHYGANLEVALMADSSHWAFREEPQATLDRIAEFVAAQTA